MSLIVKAADAAQFLSLVPRLLGCTPTRSLVLVPMARGRSLGAMRLDLPPEERLEGTLATTALGIAAGADIVRVHDVRANARAARVADAIVRGWAG